MLQGHVGSARHDIGASYVGLLATARNNEDAGGGGYNRVVGPNFLWRWSGVERPYTAEDVLRLRGSIHIEHTLARMGAERLWELLKAEPYINADTNSDNNSHTDADTTSNSVDSGPDGSKF